MYFWICNDIYDFVGTQKLFLKLEFMKNCMNKIVRVRCSYMYNRYFPEKHLVNL